MSTPKGRAALKPAPHIEIDVLERNKRPLCRTCVDWSERKHDLGGAVGAAVLAHALVKSWAGRGPHSRAVTFSVLGEKKFTEWSSLQLTRNGMKGTRLAPRDLWQKLRHRALEMVRRFMRASCGGLVDVARAPDGWVTTKVSGWRSKRGSHRVVKEPLPPYAVPEPDWHPEKLTGRETEAPAAGRAAEGWPGNAGASR